MLEQNPTKVKRKIKSFADKVSYDLSVPQHKFLLEMVSAILSSGSLNLMELSRHLKEDISLKYTYKRLQRNISNNGNFLELSNDYSLSHPAEPISEDTFIYLDGGDLTYSQATSYEQMTIVRDGSTGKFKPGYPMNMIACRNGSGRTFPVYLDTFHRNEGYTSDNTETYKAIQAFMSHHGSKGIWTMDRGYDNQRIMKYILKRKGNFNIRLTSKRYLQDGKRNIAVNEITHKINRRYHLSGGSYGYKPLHLDGEAVTLIYFKKGNVDLMLLNSGHLRKSKEVAGRIRGYFKRWGVEECYKFLKQSFGIERARVSSYEGIRCLLGISMLAWQVLISISSDEELELIAKKEAKMITKKSAPVFDYYRIIQGVKTILSQCREMFRFRKRKPIHKALTIEDFLPKQDRFAYGY